MGRGQRLIRLKTLFVIRSQGLTPKVIGLEKVFNTILEFKIPNVSFGMTITNNLGK